MRLSLRSRVVSKLVYKGVDVETQIWAEVVTIGSELVLGQLVDTNAAFIASKLSEIGIGLAYHTTVGDDRERMAEALQTALKRCQVVITTGGVGPTEDDLTREIAARVIGSKLVFRQDLMDYIEGLFKRMGYKMAPNNKRQAYIPEGAEVIHNPRGTAPCFRYEFDDRILICLPGVPWETEFLIQNDVTPYLAKKYTPGGRVWLNRVLKVCGVGESNVDAQIKDVIRSSDNPVIGIQASPGEIKVRLTAMADNQEQAEMLLNEGETRIREKIGELIFGYGDETLPGNTAELATRGGYKLAVAEGPTRGLITAEIGKHLKNGELAGARVVSGPASAEELCREALDEFDADIALAVAGVRTEDDKMRVEIRILTRTGETDGRDLIVGGPDRVVMARSATIGLFTLWRFLRQKA